MTPNDPSWDPNRSTSDFNDNFSTVAIAPNYLEFFVQSFQTIFVFLPFLPYMDMFFSQNHSTSLRLTNSNCLRIENDEVIANFTANSFSYIHYSKIINETHRIQWAELEKDVLYTNSRRFAIALCDSELSRHRIQNNSVYLCKLSLACCNSQVQLLHMGVGQNILNKKCTKT